MNKYMTILRYLGKNFAKLLNKIMNHSGDPLEQQRKVLNNIIKINFNTLYGEKHNFGEIKSVREYQRNTPIGNYSEFEPYIERMINGEKNILIGKNKQMYWGKTAGSSGNPKLIPITKKSIVNASRASLRIIISYLAENPSRNSRILDGILYFYSSNPRLGTINDIPVGFGTGVFSQSSKNMFLKYFNFNLYSPYKFYAINDFENRTKAMIKEAIDLNITSFIGVTSILVNFMEQIVKYTGVNNISEIFPNYIYSIMGGEPPKYYENRLEELTGKSIDIREIYGATEETIAAQMSSEPGLTPALDANFYEFVPVNNPEERLLINEVSKHREYYIILTNYNGLYSYNIEDVIEFISVDPPLIQFIRRKDTINLASEKITTDQLYLSIKKTDEMLKCKTKDYLICGITDPKPRYVILIEFLPDKSPENPKEFLDVLNSNLMDLNDVYADLITIQRAVLSPILWILENNSFLDYQVEQIKNGKPAGQAKIPRISVNKELLEYFEGKLVKKIE
jgi:hypothetical protein